jgi:hypothetical protein
VYKIIITTFNGVRGIGVHEHLDHSQHLLAEYDDFSPAAKRAHEAVGHPYAWTAHERIKPTVVVGLVVSAEIVQDDFVPPPEEEAP